MSDLYTWSTTADNNNSTPPDGFPENSSTADTAFMPSDINNCMREVMRAVKAGAFVRFGSVAEMQSITTSPGADIRAILIDENGTVPISFYQWQDTATGSDDGESIIIPAEGGGGAFERVAYYQASTLCVARSGAAINPKTLSVKTGGSWIGDPNSAILRLSASAAGTIAIANLTSLTAGYKMYTVAGSPALTRLTEFSLASNNFEGSARNGIRFGDGDFAMCFGDTASGGTAKSFALWERASAVNLMPRVSITVGQRPTMDTYYDVTYPWRIAVFDSTGGAATQTITSLNTNFGNGVNGPPVARIAIRPQDDTRKLLFKYGTLTTVGGPAPNEAFLLGGGGDVTLDTSRDVLVLAWDASSHHWVQEMLSKNS